MDALHLKLFQRLCFGPFVWTGVHGHDAGRRRGGVKLDKKTKIQEMHIDQNGVKVTVMVGIVLELSYLLWPVASCGVSIAGDDILPKFATPGRDASVFLTRAGCST